MFLKLINLVNKHPTTYGIKFKHLKVLKPLKQWINETVFMLKDPIYTLSTKYVG